jgi:hypothetical protein
LGYHIGESLCSNFDPIKMRERGHPFPTDELFKSLSPGAAPEAQGSPQPAPAPPLPEDAERAQFESAWEQTKDEAREM